MYFPYVSKRAPSNRECRIASTLSIIGFVGFVWLVLAVPGALVPFLVWLVAVELILGYFGVATLYIAKPNHFLLWPDRETRVVRGQPVPPLDERDVNTRYRTFLVSYRILSIAAFAIIVFIRPGATLIVATSGGHIPHWRLESADQVFVVLIWLLSLLLPYLVFPWLESDAAFDDEQGSGPVFQDAKELLPPRPRHWVRNGVVLLIIWIPIILFMVWLSFRYTHWN
jgi:hypothetical protein